MSQQWIRLDMPYQRGPAVRRWQEMLVAAGYEVETDGIFGRDTDAKTRAAQASLGLEVDGIVGPNTMEAMLARLEGGDTTPDEPKTIVDGVEVWDYRGKVPRPSNYAGERTWDQISGVMLHRTACVLGENPKRYFPVNAHIGVTMGGRIVLSHRWEDMIWHGNKPSPWTIGIEFDGNPEGFPGYYWKPGGGPHDITPAQVEAAGVLLSMLKDAFAAHGRKFAYIYAHRQSSSQRECDPGWQCWQKIAIPWMDATGATPGDVGVQGTVFGSGQPIPKHWDPRSPIKTFWSE